MVCSLPGKLPGLTQGSRLDDGEKTSSVAHGAYNSTCIGAHRKGERSAQLVVRLIIHIYFFSN